MFEYHDVIGVIGEHRRCRHSEQPSPNAYATMEGGDGSGSAGGLLYAELLRDSLRFGSDEEGVPRPCRSRLSL